MGSMSTTGKFLLYVDACAIPGLYVHDGEILALCPRRPRAPTRVESGIRRRLAVREVATQPPNTGLFNSGKPNSIVSEFLYLVFPKGTKRGCVSTSWAGRGGGCGFGSWSRGCVFTSWAGRSRTCEVHCKGHSYVLQFMNS